MPTDAELTAHLQGHAFACLDGLEPGPMRLLERVSEGGSLSAELVFAWPTGGLDAALKREAEATLSEFAGCDVTLKVSWQVPDFLSPPLPGQPGVRNLLAVSSAKGGVGKSTLAANLALALSHRGARVGLLDADIQGPNIPTLLGLDPDVRPRTEGEGEQRLLIPVGCAGIHTISMGMLAAQGAAVSWRGPMVSGALKQLMLRTSWGELDYLIVDMPPGTGDISLTLAQSAPLNAALLVSTADAMARADTIRGADMFRKLKVPLLGLVENISYWQCPSCDTRQELFDRHAGDAIDLPLIGSIPLLPPVAGSRAQLLAEPDADAAKHWRRVADAVAIALAASNAVNRPAQTKILRRISR